MKVTLVEDQVPDFKPYTLQIVVESQEQHDAMQCLTSLYNTVPECVFSNTGLTPDGRSLLVLLLDGLGGALPAR